MKKYFMLGLLFATMAFAQMAYADSCATNCSTNCSTSCADACGTTDCNSHSAFIPRGLTTNAMLELALGNYAFYHQNDPENRACFQFQASYFHLQSRKNSKLARYFLPNGQSSILVNENGSGDVNALEFGLINQASAASFSERFTICPERKVDGAYFNFYFDFSDWSCWLNGVWAEIAFAAARVQHRLNPRDLNVENPGTLDGIATMTDALNNPAWTAGRFYTGCRTKSGVDDIMFKLGWNHYFCDQDHIGAYLVGVAPTGKGTRALNVFEPLIGSNHGRFGAGLNTDWTAYECETHRLNWMMDLRYLYAFKGCERRSFDLCGNGDWSRYLLVVSDDARANTQPGINVFTQNVDVTPRSTIDLWTCLNWQWCNWNLELDYNLFWRQSERICFNKCSVNDLGVGIFDINGLCSGNPISASTMNISQTLAAAATTGNVAPSDAAFVTETLADLNKKSGAAPTALSSTIALAGSYTSEVCCRPFTLGVGGLYEIAHRKAALENWGLFVKGMISF